MTDYGSDFAGIDDLDAELSIVEGPRVVIESVARRYGCTPGSLEDDPRYGYNLTLLVGESGVDAAEVERKMVEQASLDDRVASAPASVQLLDSGLLETSMQLELSGGERFELIQQVSSLKIEDIVIREAE